jgi:predicted alpha/beta hydrolase family esterase
VTTGVVFIQGGGAGAHQEDSQLAGSLERNLGDDFSVDFPKMPQEDEPDYERWRPVIGRALARTTGPVVLVGHSVGGYLLIKYLVSEGATSPIAAVCIIAAPFPGGDPAWSIDGFKLPDDFAERLPRDAPVLLYASEDDDIVPFAHRDLYAAAIPHAITRSTSGGHQLAGDLRVVADDIRRIVAE